MITVHPGSHAYRLLQLLSIAGEISTASLSILGNARVMASLVRKLESVQDIRFDKAGPVYHGKLIQVSGKKDTRTIRLYKKGIPVLDGLYPGLYGWYASTFSGRNFSSDIFHVQRNHRVAETLAMCTAAGIEIRPYVLPALQKNTISRIVPDMPSFYIARELKKAGGDESNKIDFTRITGALFCSGNVYTVYNTRDAVMRWSGLGEVKTVGNLLELARMNAGLDSISGAILFGGSQETALNTILESDKSRRLEMRFDRIYNKIHYMPLNPDGVRLLKMLVLPDWNERLLSALFEPEQRSYNRGRMEYDAVVDGRLIFSHLDGDLARLIRFRDSLNARAEPADILCYPWQTGFLQAYIGKLAGLRELGADAVEAATVS